MTDKVLIRSGLAADRPTLTAREPSIDSDTNMAWIGTALGNLALNQSQNLMINSGMGVAQRGTSFTIATASSAYTLDRIKSINNGSGVNSTVSQVAVSDQDGAGYGIQMVHASTPSAGGALMHVYTLEAKDAYKWAGRTLTVSAKVKGVLAMDQATLKARYKTSESAISDSSTLIVAGTATTINNSGETTVSLKFTVPSRATLTTSGVWGVQIVASKSSSEASGDGFIVTEWQINPGDVPMPYQPLSLAEELLACMRYFELLDFNALTTLVRSGTNKIYTNYPFKVQKRVPPTLSNASDVSTTLGTGSKQVSFSRNVDDAAITATGNVTVGGNPPTFMTKNMGSIVFAAATSFSGTAGDTLYIAQTTKDTITGFDSEL